MDKRLLVGLVACGVAVAAASISTTATLSSIRNDSPARPERAQNVERAKKATSNEGATADGVVTNPRSNSPENGRDTADYWTPQRMKDARPLEKNLAGGSPPPSREPTPDIVPANVPVRSAPARIKPNRKRAQAANTPDVVISPTTDDNAEDYWTQDRMDDAQPMEKTIPGGDGSAGSSGSGSSTSPGIAP